MNKTVIDSLNRLILIHKSMHRRYLEELGLFFGQPRLMYQIHLEPGLSQQTLVERLSVSKEAVSMSVRRLEKKGFIQRVVDENDKRKFNLYLSESGKEILKAVWIVQNETYSKLLEPLDEDQKEDFRELCDLITEHARKEIEI